MITYAQYTRNRKPEFKLITGYEIIDNNKVVFKQAANESSEEFADSLLEKYSRLLKCNLPFKPVHAKKENGKIYFEFIIGQTLANIVEYHLHDGNQEQVVQVVQDYINYIYQIASDKKPDISKSIEFFGEGISKCEKWIDCGLIDLDLGNIIQKDDELFLIDYEWMFDFPVPCDFIIFRALNDLVVHKLGGKNLKSDRLYLEYQKYIKEELIKAEFNFQNYVVEKQNNNYREFEDSCKNFKPLDYNPIEFIQDKIRILQAKDESIQSMNSEVHKLQHELSAIKNRRPVKVALKIGKLANKLRRVFKR